MYNRKQSTASDSAVTTSSKGHNNNTSKRNKQRKLLPPLTTLECIVVICLLFCAGVFLAMQIIFAYKLYWFELVYDNANNNDISSRRRRNMVQTQATPLQLPTSRQNNRAWIQYHTNRTRRAHVPETPLPPLDTIVDTTTQSFRMDRSVTTPITSRLLDFAVLGFEKSGSRTLKQLLHEHVDTRCGPRMSDNSKLWYGKVVEFVQQQYDKHAQQEAMHRTCYSNNNDLYPPSQALPNLDTYFPHTNLVLAIRHPIRYVSTSMIMHDYDVDVG